jgi:hypothetical protein
VLIPARSDFDPDTIDLTFKHVHQFELVQNIVVTAHLIPETQLDLPPGAEETRDNALYRILHHNQLDDLIFRIDKNVARRAFDTLGDLLIARTEDQSQLQSIIDGAILFKDVPALQGAGEQLRLTDEDRSALRKLVVKFTSNAELREFNLICDNVRVKMRGGSGAALISKDELTLLRSLAQIKSPDS